LSRAWRAFGPRRREGARRREARKLRSLNRAQSVLRQRCSDLKIAHGSHGLHGSDSMIARAGLCLHPGRGRPCPSVFIDGCVPSAWAADLKIAARAGLRPSPLFSSLVVHQAHERLTGHRKASAPKRSRVRAHGDCFAEPAHIETCWFVWSAWDCFAAAAA
jgi:hypothetical protein